MTRQQRQILKKQNKRQSWCLCEVPRKDWPNQDGSRLNVWRSRGFLVQAFEEENGVIRLSINRTAHNGESWNDDITWDEINLIKRQLGFYDDYAIEIYPRDRDLVNVANMRHIWILPEPLDVGWLS